MIPAMKNITCDLARWPRCRRRVIAGDRGSAALWLAITMVGLLAMAGLVLDGGAAIGAREQAADVAQQAARAGANALSAGGVFSTSGGSNTLGANPSAATAAATSLLTAAGVTDFHISVQGNIVVVTAHVSKPTALLSAVGVNTVGGSATEQAQALLGTTTGG
jgi:Flp pilus assembly protein TadG